MKRSRSITLASSWVIFWEGALIAHFFGLMWAAIWCGACLLFASGVRLGLKARRR